MRLRIRDPVRPSSDLGAPTHRAADVLATFAAAARALAGPGDEGGGGEGGESEGALFARRPGRPLRPPRSAPHSQRRFPRLCRVVGLDGQGLPVGPAAQAPAAAGEGRRG